MGPTGYIHAEPSLRDRVGSYLRGRRIPVGFRPTHHTRLREYAGKPWDQGVNACTGFALCKMVATLARADGILSEPELSAFSVYTPARLRRQEDIRDEGARVADVAWAWNNVGACAEHIWPSWSISKKEQQRTVNDVPAPFRMGAIAANGAFWRRRLAIRVRPVLDTPGRIPERIAHSLDKGQGVLVAVNVGDDFDHGTGVIKPQPPKRGTHLVCVLDWRYNDAGEMEFLILNSWGEDWGEGGYRWASAAFLAQSRSVYFVELMR